MNFGDERLKRLPWGNGGQEPLHLLEAHRLAFIKKKESSTMEHEKKILGIFKSGKIRSEERSLRRILGYPYRSVTELRRRGIRFRPSSCSLEDIRFSRGRPSGVLHLPVLLVNSSTKVFLSNMIALEMSPANKKTSLISAYVNFIKSLIMKSDDVEVLRGKGILINCLGKDEDVVKMLEDISTDGTNNGNIYEEVYFKLHEHCHYLFNKTIGPVLYYYSLHADTLFNLYVSTLALWLAAGQTYLAYLQISRKQN